MEENGQNQIAVNRRGLDKRLEVAGWGLFFIWIGTALFAHVGWGAGLLGVGIIILVAQTARKYFARKWEGFGVAVGFIFVVAGISKLLNVHLGLVPILCIIAGIALLVSTLVGRPRD